MNQPAGSSGRQSVSSRPRFNRLALAALLVLGVAGIVGLTLWWRAQAPLERADLEADPAFRLEMPGADELARVGGDRMFTLDGVETPFAGHIYGTAATSAEVYAFYERELARLGWKADPPPFARSTTELETRTYCKPRKAFRLAISDQRKAFRPEFYRGRTYQTVFDATLGTVDVDAPCPLPSRPPRTP